jgi:hypothetical protein
MGSLVRFITIWYIPPMSGQPKYLISSLVNIFPDSNGLVFPSESNFVRTVDRVRNKQVPEARNDPSSPQL